jgi:hypothetical protein
MRWSFRSPIGADVFRRSVKHASATSSTGYLGESHHQNAREFWRLSELERRFLIFGLELAIAFTASAGVIFAIFAWTGAGL